MAISTSTLAAHSLSQKQPISTIGALDTTVGSVVHQAFGYGQRSALRSKIPLPAVYIVAIAVTFLPLLIAALLSSGSLTAVTSTLRLPFLRDWTTLFGFLVTFPSLVVFTVNDQQVLSSALDDVQQDGTLTIADESANLICVLWQRRFRVINYSGQALGLIVGAVVVYFNYVAYLRLGYWIAENGRLLPVGFVFLGCILVFYWLTLFFILRGITISLLLRDIVAHAQLRMLPLHPDKAGGLRPVGHLGLRNQYLLTVFGLNVAIFAAVSFHYFHPVSDTLMGLIAAALIAYLILGPLVFLAPLLSFRGGMLRAKSELLEEVAGRMSAELQRLRTQLKSGQISREDEEFIDRLRKIGSMVDELPVWPFDATTLRKFVAAYLIPAISSGGYSLAKTIYGIAEKYWS